MPTRRLPVMLTEDEIAERGRAVAKAVEKRASLQEEKKAQTATINGDIKLQGEIIRTLSRVIAAGTEDREVEVLVTHDHVNRKVIVSREDTGEVVEERPMTVEELQTRLFPPAKPAREKKQWQGGGLPGADDRDGPAE